MGTADQALITAVNACVTHARDLLESSRAVFSGGRPHIAYHLAALALEELGRRELILVQSTATAHRGDAPPWMDKHTQDHVKKLFWALFSGLSIAKVTPQKFTEMQRFAKAIHSTRLQGLYVESSADGISVPAQAVRPEACTALIDFVSAHLEMVETAKPREDISQEERDVQAWFLNMASDPQTLRLLLNPKSMAKLAELDSALAWAKWLRGEFAKADAEGRTLAEEAIREGNKRVGQRKTKDKWKIRVRILCDSHSIRPKVVKAWNDRVDWIKLVPVPDKKNQLIVEFVLGDNVPVQGLWFFGWGLARSFVTALNIATMGFWWWHLPRDVSRYYEEIRDLDHKNMAIKLERSPILKTDWGANRVLTEEDLVRAAACFASLPGPDVTHPLARPLGYYIGGVTFLSLNDIHWQCENQAFLNFLHALVGMASFMGEWEPDSTVDALLSGIIDQIAPEMEAGERAAFLALANAVHRGNTEPKPNVTLKEASFSKLFCDYYWMKKVQPRMLEERRMRREVNEPDAETNSSTGTRE